MIGGNGWEQPDDQIAHGTVHRNNALNAMSPLHHAASGTMFKNRLRLI
jgi:hypothetical protein